jgi:ATP-dependent DNA helicase RecG
MLLAILKSQSTCELHGCKSPSAFLPPSQTPAAESEALVPPPASPLAISSHLAWIIWQLETLHAIVYRKAQARNALHRRRCSTRLRHEPGRRTPAGFESWSRTQRTVRGLSFDEEPLPELNSEAIDFRVASECFAPVRQLSRADLRSMHLITTHQRREVPTVGGVLLFGVDRLRQFPDAFLRVGCFQGTDRSVIIDSAEITVSPVLAVEQALQFAQRNTRRALAIGGVHHHEAWEFPVVALREAITNAIVHADYGQRGASLRLAIFADRIEVDNPGNLLSGLTIEGIRRGVSKLRNRVIGRVFHELQLIEQWGSGVQRMISACRQAGLPEPELEEIGSGFRVTLRRERTREPQIDPVDAAILETLRDSPGASTRQIAAKAGRTPRAVRTRLARLVQLSRDWKWTS